LDNANRSNKNIMRRAQNEDDDEEEEEERDAKLRPTEVD